MPITLIQRIPCIAFALLILFSPSIARAQTDAGALRALIADPSSGVVPGATVTLTNTATGVAKTLVSDTEGYVAFTPVQRGSYDLGVELSGFRTREIKAITVDDNERKFLRVARDGGRGRTYDPHQGARNIDAPANEPAFVRNDERSLSFRSRSSFSWLR